MGALKEDKCCPEIRNGELGEGNTCPMLVRGIGGATCESYMVLPRT